MGITAAPERILRTAHDAQLPFRLHRSAACSSGAALSDAAAIEAWLAERGRVHTFDVRRIPFEALEGWSFAPDTGNLVHRTGRFFSVEGLAVTSSGGPLPQWHQPIINQPEIGILGILVKEFDGVLHFLMQAKMEPGNPRMLQLAPTVQATRSNYMRVHQGNAVRYLEYFAAPRRGRVVTDVLQSEHGWWFYRKRNRNMIVEADGEVELHDDFCWMTLGQINELMNQKNAVNMDARTVLSCLPPAASAPLGPGGFHDALAASRDPQAGAAVGTVELLSWFTEQRARLEFTAKQVPLAGLPGWRRTDEAIVREDGRHFQVVAVDVKASSREVSGWSQPLFEPNGLGIAAFVVKRIEGVLHVLAHAKIESGFLDTVELGPTVQCRPGNYDESEQPFLLDYVLGADPSRIRFDTIHSEEGGRFLNAEFRYLIVEADDSLPAHLPEEYTWVTAWQLGDLLLHGHYVSVQARSLVACLNAVR
ncbi:NDP-hexose 2,3-dehydratase family protein [Actinocrinis sp.]|uniref:NDP-hexose 2,3-dehydratase family protein n=1 Tax=Actinocrinis sp. TaxID=1920516 RepID=UPI002C1B3F77|nr:NDP-hexose 2,3-dehydratase family protein [Actinocrinis sp.]HXR70962.1 NDP-hexose 2,3-dehydratase family protein [Actinocrinis sp.]